jgi:hypothetical protein
MKHSAPQPAKLPAARSHAIAPYDEEMAEWERERQGGGGGGGGGGGAGGVAGVQGGWGPVGPRFFPNGPGGTP